MLNVKHVKIFDQTYFAKNINCLWYFSIKRYSKKFLKWFSKFLSKFHYISHSLERISQLSDYFHKHIMQPKQLKPHMLTVIPILRVNRLLLRDPQQLPVLFSVLYIACIKKKLAIINNKIHVYKALHTYVMVLFLPNEANWGNCFNQFNIAANERFLQNSNLICC